MTAALSIRGVGFSIDGVPILTGIDLEVGSGEVVAVLGPSGSGKTTLLSVIAGFVVPDSGEVVIGGRTVTGPGGHLPPERRGIGFVFQSYALWPHLTAAETVAFPLRVAGMSAAEADRRAGEILDTLGIGDLGGRRPAELSGGQQQRVGVARALARDADLYLLDEPTAHLDGATRIAAERLIDAQRTARGAAAVYATHDAAEALGMADRVALLREGRIVQVGSPRQVYEEPVDEWAAVLTGPVSIVPEWPGVGRAAIRPEWVTLDGDLPATVADVRYRGSHTEVTLDTGSGSILARVGGESDRRPGDAVRWSATRVWPLLA